VLVGRTLGDKDAPESRLYAANHHHLLRPGSALWRDTI
jgi:precorrin-4 methylase